MSFVVGVLRSSKGGLMRVSSANCEEFGKAGGVGAILGGCAGIGVALGFRLRFLAAC